MSEPGMPHMPEDPELQLNDADRLELGSIDVLAILAQCRKVEFLRKRAREQCLTAEKLEDLRSKSGQPFVEDDEKKTFRDYRTAATQEDEYEVAYLCRFMYIEELGLTEGSGCGWVKGEPLGKPYDDMGPLCGSKGYRQYCKICGDKIGETQLVVW